VPLTPLSANRHAKLPPLLVEPPLLLPDPELPPPLDPELPPEPEAPPLEEPELLPLVPEHDETEPADHVPLSCLHSFWAVEAVASELSSAPAQ